jgi:hypothetical protein
MLELVFFLATTPASMPHNPKLSALFNKWKQRPTEENRSVFHAAMDRALEPDKHRQRIALYLFFINGVALCLLFHRLKRLERS